MQNTWQYLDLREALHIVETKAQDMDNRGNDWKKLCSVAIYLRRQYKEAMQSKVWKTSFAH